MGTKFREERIVVIETLNHGPYILEQTRKINVRLDRHSGRHRTSKLNILKQ
jgi:hypothetical protein